MGNHDDNSLEGGGFLIQSAGNDWVQHATMMYTVIPPKVEKKKRLKIAINSFSIFFLGYIKMRIRTPIFVWLVVALAWEERPIFGRSWSEIRRRFLALAFMTNAAQSPWSFFRTRETAGKPQGEREPAILQNI